MVTVQGIHHITAIGSSAQELVHFYTTVLGLRFVKKTVNQDDTATYHLFFGDRLGEPGMDLTFFTFMPPLQGINGTGLVTTISLAVPQTSLSFWLKRFKSLNIKYESTINQFDLDRITFYGPDNQRLQLVGVPTSALPKNQTNLWSSQEVMKAHAIRHFHSATLTVSSLIDIQPILLEVLRYQKITAKDQLSLYHLPGHKRAAFLVVEELPELEPGFNAAGTVHHIAFSVENEAEQLEMRSRVINAGLHPTPVIDRFYFKSVYFRTPAGILFEIATKGPGFLADQTEDELGKKLSLPPFLEEHRQKIESHLEPIG